jgi:hypothetical protein
MVRHLTIVAIEFRLAGFLLALPAIATLLMVADIALDLHELPPPDDSPPLDVGTYGFIALMANVARGLGPILRAIAGVAGWVAIALAAAAFVVLLFAALLYLTGRGIGQQATWARIIAIALSVGLALVSCAVMATLRRDMAVFATAPLGLSLYTLWVLIWRFA